MCKLTERWHPNISICACGQDMLVGRTRVLESSGFTPAPAVSHSFASKDQECSESENNNGF